MKRQLVLSLILLFAVTGGCKKRAKESQKNTPPAAKGKTGSGAGVAKKSLGTTTKQVPVRLFVMSQCPYGVMAEGIMDLVLGLVQNEVDFKLEYIVDELPGGGFKSLHGQPEVEGNIIQLCVQEKSPKKFLSFLKCHNQNPQALGTTWKACAQQVGVDVDSLKNCKEGEEGKRLLRASGKRARGLKVEGSPTYFIAGKQYQGPPSPRKILDEICRHIPGKKHPNCIAPKVKAYFISDKRCEKCKQFERMVVALKNIVGGVTVTKLDYSDPKAKAIMKRTKTTLLPVILFEDEVLKDKLALKILKPIMQTEGKLHRLNQPRPFFDPTAEICDNKVDDDKDGKIDCADDGCKGHMACRPEQKKRLDVFVMSQCPYGAAALLSMESVLKNFGKEIDFHVNYIATLRKDGGFDSLHGQSEVDENIRQLCAHKHYAKDNKYMEYLWCRSKDYKNPNWETCAKNGIEKAVIAKCVASEGKKLLEENVKLASKLEIGGSPTWLTNNRYKFQGVDAERIKTKYCEKNPKLKGCKSTLSSKKTVKGSCGG